jgi:hypothetical protein
MATVNLGKIKPTWRNAWASGTAYTVDDMVSHGGTSYMCISNVSGTTTPNADASNWDSMAVKGDTGNTGSQGVTGNTGSQGPIGNTGPSGIPSGGSVGQVVTNTAAGAGGWADVAAGGKLIQHKAKITPSITLNNTDAAGGDVELDSMTFDVAHTPNNKVYIQYPLQTYKTGSPTGDYWLYFKLFDGSTQLNSKGRVYWSGGHILYNNQLVSHTFTTSSSAILTVKIFVGGNNNGNVGLNTQDNCNGFVIQEIGA